MNLLTTIASLLFIFGAFDDMAKIIGKKGQGLGWMQKLMLHFIIGCIFGSVFYFTVAKSIPYLLFVILFFIFFVNAVNISDGLNGLAIGNFIIVLGSMSIGFYHYGSLEMLNLCVVLLGMCLAFFVFNIKGKMFMGDAGASMLGWLLAMIAIFGKLKMMVFIAGMFFVLEGGSSFVQVFGRWSLGRRLLPFACPVHHHFVNKGASERKIVVISWVFSSIMGVLGLSLIW